MDNKLVKELPDNEREALINKANSLGIKGVLQNFKVSTLKEKMNKPEAIMDKTKDDELEEKLLRKKELQEEIQKKQFELAELNQSAALMPKEKKLITDFNSLKVVTDGKNIIDTQVFHKNATYEYFNEANGQITLLNGKQAEGVFGMRDKDMVDFGKKELGSIYQGKGFTLKFKHYETY